MNELDATTLEDKLINENIVQDFRKVLPVNPAGVKLFTRNRDQIRGVSVHQSFSECSILELANYHVGPNHHTMDGFERTPYHLAIERSGNVLLLNDFTVSSSIDAGTIMIIMQGCFPYGRETEFYGEKCSPPNAEQFDKLRFVWYYIKDQLKLTNLQMYGHYHYGNPDCPGNDFRRLIEEIRNT